MNKCPKCGIERPDVITVCPYDGQPLVASEKPSGNGTDSAGCSRSHEPMSDSLTNTPCPNSGHDVDASLGQTSCSKCGAKLAPAPPSSTQQVSPVTQQDQANERRLGLFELVNGYGGRISRSTFFLGTLFVFSVIFVSRVIIQTWLERATFYEAEAPPSIEVPMYIVGLISFLGFLALSVKRLHDFNASGYWCLLYLLIVIASTCGWIPAILVRYFVWCAALVLCSIPGTPGPNYFGPRSGFAFTRGSGSGH